MKIRVICIGKIKEKYLNLGIEEYLKRLKVYSKIEVIELNETRITDNPSDAQVEEVLKDEGQKIMKHLNKDEYTITLDLHGKELDNLQYVDMIEKNSLNGYSTFTFIIGGSYGISKEVIERVKFRWCLSKLTFTHQMIRLILFEQIYRGFKIMNNEPYHK